MCLTEDMASQRDSAVCLHGTTEHANDRYCEEAADKAASMRRSITASEQATAGQSGSGKQGRRSFVPDHVKNPGVGSRLMASQVPLPWQIRLPLGPSEYQCTCYAISCTTHWSFSDHQKHAVDTASAFRALHMLRPGREHTGGRRRAGEWRCRWRPGRHGEGNASASAPVFFQACRVTHWAVCAMHCLLHGG